MSVAGRTDDASVKMKTDELPLVPPSYTGDASPVCACSITDPTTGLG